MNGATWTTPAPGIPATRRWIALGALFLAQMITLGTTTFGYSLFVKPLTQEFGLSRADAGLGAISIIVGISIWSPFIGKAIDGLPPRKVLVAGSLLFCAGMAIVALSSNVWLNLLSAVVLIGGGTAILGPVCGSTLAARWFPEYTGRALGIISTSGPVGGAIFVPVLAWLQQHYGWRGALGITAGLVAILVALPLLLIIRGAMNSAPRFNQAAGGSPTITRRDLLTSSSFWLIIFVFGSSFAIVNSILTNLVLFTDAQDISAERGVLLLSIISISGIAGKLLAGWLLDRGVNLKTIQFTATICLALFMISISLRVSYEIIVLCGAAAGMAIGATTLMWIAFVKWSFGSGALGSTLGFMVPIQTPFVFGWLYLVGRIYDVSKSYGAVFQISLIYLGIVAFTMLWIKKASFGGNVHSSTIGAPEK